MLVAARTMLSKLSGGSHEVCTGVALIYGTPGNAGADGSRSVEAQTPPHPIPSHPNLTCPAHPVPSDPIPYHPTSYPIRSQLIPSHPTPSTSHRVSMYPIPSRPSNSIQSKSHPILSHHTQFLLNSPHHTASHMRYLPPIWLIRPDLVRSGSTRSICPFLRIVLPSPGFLLTLNHLSRLPR